MKKALSLLGILFSCFTVFSQSTITLAFSAVDSATNSPLPLEAVVLSNLTLGCDTTLYGEAPVLTMIYVGTGNHNTAGKDMLIVAQPAPNPFNNTTSVQVQLRKAGTLNSEVFSSEGRRLSSYAGKMSPGMYEFEINASSIGMHLLVFTFEGERKVVKLINNSSHYAGAERISLVKSEKSVLKSEANSGFRFEAGNQLSAKSVKAGYHENLVVFSPTQDTSVIFSLSIIQAPPAVVTSTIVTGITQSSATIRYSVTDYTVSEVTARGVCWSRFPTPTIDSSHTSDGTGTGNFETVISGLTFYTPYYVRSYAINDFGIAYSNEISFVTSDTNVFLDKIASSTSKTWKLLRDVNTGRYPLEVGPENHSSIWWALGYNNLVGDRYCMFNDEFILGHDMSLHYDTKGDYWAEGGVFNPGMVCSSTSDTMVGPNGEDLSAWGDGNHTFRLKKGSPDKITAVGLGAFLGFYKLGDGIELHVPADSVTYNIIKLYDGDVDTLIIEGYYRWEPTTPGGYWRFVLVHYDDPADEPPITCGYTIAGFDFSVTGRTVTLVNTSVYAESYLWDFGDGTTSTETNPTHTYTSDSLYIITLTASNLISSSEYSNIVPISTSVLTIEKLRGVSWQVRVGRYSVCVGSGLGKHDWWSVPPEYFTNYPTSMDDWSCMPDDKFTFGFTGNFAYQTFGSARNDGYFGYPSGCWDDFEIASSPGAPFGTCLTHTYTFIPASGNQRAVILLTNGPGFAAFLGFYRGYYGGENGSSIYPPNGGNQTNRYEVMAYVETGTMQYLYVSVDTSVDHTGTSAWSIILERPKQ